MKLQLFQHILGLNQSFDQLIAGCGNLSPFHFLDDISSVTRFQTSR